MAKADGFTPLRFERLSSTESVERSAVFLDEMRRRRSVRDFSTDPVPIEIIENAILTAGTAPSGANQQPWRFVVVTDPASQEVDSRSRRSRGARKLRAPDERRMAGGARTARHNLGESPTSKRPGADRRVQTRIWAGDER